MSQPPPGWAARVAWLRAIIDRAEAQILAAALHGGPTLVAEQKRMVAYRNLDALMAMRPKPPPAPPRRSGTFEITIESRSMFVALEHQVNAEAARQRALRKSFDAASRAPQQARETQHGKRRTYR